MARAGVRPDLPLDRGHGARGGTWLVEEIGRRPLGRLVRVGLCRRGDRARGERERGDEQCCGRAEAAQPHQTLVQPPSTGSTMPVTKLLASDAR